jgi:hypothetical protein
MSVNTVATYQGRIAAQHANKPKFMATIALSVGVYVQIQNLFNSIMMEGGIFDLATPPVGDQEDIIGELVGAPRDIPVPIPGVYFTWDGNASLGWDSGVWAPTNGGTDLTVLPDDVYLKLILAKIATNHWDGTTEGAYAVWNALGTAFTLLIMDLQNMHFIVAIVGGPVDTLTLALLTQGYLPLRPGGVMIDEYIVSVDTNPLFAWDVENAYMAGWDQGSWGQEIPAS